MRRLRLALPLTLAACTQLPAPAPVGPGGPAAPEPVAAVRSLYRVRYQGPEGSGSLRLVLRQVAAKRFQMEASDTFGRAVWSLDLDGEQVLLIDHRRREACITNGELRVPELALRQLPLPAVARVLASRTPLPAPPGVDRTDWTDDTGQRWTAAWEEGELASWSLWQEGEPRLSWRRQPGGGVLSHRDGSQFRWRQVAAEGFPPVSYQRLEAPAEFRFGACVAGSETGHQGAAGAAAAEPPHV